MNPQVRGEIKVPCSKCGDDFTFSVDESSDYASIQNPCGCGGLVTLSAAAQRQYFARRKVDLDRSPAKKGGIAPKKAGSPESPPKVKVIGPQDFVDAAQGFLRDAQLRERLRSLASRNPRFSKLLDDFRRELTDEFAAPGDQASRVVDPGASPAAAAESGAKVGEPVTPPSPLDSTEHVRAGWDRIRKRLESVEGSRERFLSDQRELLEAIKAFGGGALDKSPAREGGAAGQVNPTDPAAGEAPRAADGSTPSSFFRRFHLHARSRDEKEVRPGPPRKPRPAAASSLQEEDLDVSAVLAEIATSNSVAPQLSPFPVAPTPSRLSDLEGMLRDLPELLDALEEKLDLWEDGSELNRDERKVRGMVLEVLRSMKKRQSHWKNLHQIESFPNLSDGVPCPFDRTSHRRVETRPNPGDQEHGSISDVAYLGYRWKGELLRKAEVVLWGPSARSDPTGLGGASRADGSVRPDRAIDGETTGTHDETSPGTEIPAGEATHPAELDESAGPAIAAEPGAGSDDEPAMSVRESPDGTVADRVCDLEPTSPIPRDDRVGDNPSPGPLEDHE